MTTKPPTTTNSPSEEPGDDAEPQKPKELLHIKSEDHDGLLVTWDQTATHMRTSIDVTQPGARAKISQCLENADATFTNAVGKVIDVVDFFAHVTDSPPDMNGEISPKWRLVLMLADGTTLSTWSQPAVKGFAFVANQAGPGPWNPPLQFRIRVNNKGQGQKYYTVSEVYTPPAGSLPAKASKRA